MIEKHKDTEVNMKQLQERAEVAFEEIFSGAFIVVKRDYSKHENVTSLETIMDYLNSTIKTVVKSTNGIYANFPSSKPYIY